VGLSGQDADVLIEALLKRTYRRMPRPANKEKGIAAEDCPFTGLNRGQLYELLNRSENGEIKTVSMRQEGETRAARLYNVGSVLDYRSNNSICLRINDSENCREDLFELTGILTSRYMLDCMQKIERALERQIKLKLFLDKMKITAVLIPNGLDVGLVRIKIGRDGIITESCADDRTLPSAAAVEQVRSYVEEFKFSLNSIQVREKPSEGVDTSGLNLA
jgi:hypothetical protein